MKNFYLILFLCWLCNNYGFSQTSSTTVIDAVGITGLSSSILVFEPELSTLWIDTIAQPFFWRRIMVLSPDSGLINIGATRKIIEQVAIVNWDKKTDEQKEYYRDSIRQIFCLQKEDKVFLTSGKNDFYQLKSVLPSIDKAVQIFINDSTDPFYAQAILLIESPNKLQKSNAGAYGSFQLMKKVAVDHGLIVNKKLDERKDFDKSAHAAAHLIRTICIPEAKIILAKHNIVAEENELWFHLFVLHVYHAGSGNVEHVIDTINPTVGSMQLIFDMWKTKVGKFGNASQNYSQVALASLLELQKMVLKESNYLYLCD